MILLNHIIASFTNLYGDSGKLNLRSMSKIFNGNSSNNTEIAFPAHSGTNIDVTFYFDEKGRKLEDYPPEL